MNVVKVVDLALQIGQPSSTAAEIGPKILTIIFYLQ
jgi:hypothetical protein